MSVFVIVGGIGCGKTAFLTWLLFRRWEEGYGIYSNYGLKGLPYTPIKSMNDMDDITGVKSALGLDEIWVAGGDSRQSSKNVKFTKYMLQSRKFAKRSDVFSTSQTWGQVDVRIRSIAKAVILPEIVSADGEGKPRILRAEVWNLEKERWVKPIIAPLQMVFGGKLFDICECYDTGEFIEVMQDDKMRSDILLINKYRGRGDLNQQDLSVALEYDKDVPCNKNHANSLARFIKMKDRGVI